jgi:hypothetical protein
VPPRLENTFDHSTTKAAIGGVKDDKLTRRDGTLRRVEVNSQ